MTIWISPLIGGLAGTAVMTLFLFIPNWVGWGRVDIIRAVGALVMHRSNKTFLPGFVIHIFSGIIFAYIYQAILFFSHIPLNVWTGLMMGALHGSFVMLLVSIMIMEHHPIAYYHTRGPMTGFAQLLAHIIYGLVVGCVVQYLS